MPIGGLIAGGALMAGAAGSDGKKYARDALNLWLNLKESNFDTSKLTAPELQLVGEFFPELYNAQIAGPAAMTADSPEMRAEQARHLGEVSDVAREGMPLADRLATEDIGRSLSAEQRRATEMILQNLQSRGRIGGGSELAARLSSGQAGAEQARGYGSDIAREAIQRRLQAAQSAGSMSGAIRNEDINLNSQNANAMNRWNEWVSQLRSGAAAANAAAQNQAGMRNLGERQRVSDTNTLNRYGNAQYNQQNYNDLQEQAFRQRLAKTAGASGAYGLLGQYQNARQAAKAQAIRGIGQGVDDTSGSLIGGLL